MTPGREALAEAMRLESARIYGRTLPDTATYVDRRVATDEASTAQALILLRRGNLARTITLRTGLTDEQIVAIADANGITVRRDFRRLRVVRGAA